MRLKWFTRGVIGLAFLVLIMQVFLRSHGEAIAYFGSTLILIGAGFELVRVELEEMKKRIGSQGKP